MTAPTEFPQEFKEWYEKLFEVRPSERGKREADETVFHIWQLLREINDRPHAHGMWVGRVYSTLKGHLPSAEPERPPLPEKYNPEWPTTEYGRKLNDLIDAIAGLRQEIDSLKGRT